MTPRLYLLCTVLPILVSTALCLADSVRVRSRSVDSNSQALVKRSDTQPTLHENPDVAEDLELLDIVLVASVDGKFHALNRTSGQTLWSMSSFATTTSVSAPSTLGPLVRTTHVDVDPDLADDTTHQEMYIIEPQSGDIYIMATPTSSLQRFPFSMPELVDISPFTYEGDEERRVFIGRKETSLLLIELETGKVKATLNSECPWDPFEDLRNDELDVDLDELEDGPLKASPPTEVFIGRTDYHISIYSRPTNRTPGTPLPPVQNLSFSTYGPNNQDNQLQASYRVTQDEGYIQSLPNGQIIYFKAKSTGNGASSGGQAVWGRNFNSPIVAVFDVLQKPSHPHKAHPFVLLQPRPRLQDVIPNLSHNARLPNLDSAYVGMVEETGSLFAMSPDNFPLVVFGGSERYSQGRLLDSAIPDTDHKDDEHVPTTVDEITRLRKQRQRLDDRKRDSCLEDSRDRRCLVGVRRLEDGDGHESRMRRLLDGPVRGTPSWSDVEQETQPNGSTPIDEDPDIVLAAGGARDAGRFWEAVAIAVIVGMLSVWLIFRRIKSKVKKSWRILVEEERKAEEQKASEVYVNGVTTPSTTEIPTIPLPAVPVDVEPVQEQVQPPVTNGFKDSPKSLPRSLLVVDDGDESGVDGEGDGDPVATPGKRKGRRGKRGKKKKGGAIAGAGEEGEEEKKSNGAANGSGIAVPVVAKDVEPLPSPQPSLVITSSPKLAPSGPSLIVSDTILGFGSHGTVVFQGSLQGRAVAVKRLLQDFVTLASREVSILQESDDHPNVIRYYYQEAHANFLYIALELCPASLADVIECPDRDQFREIAISFDPKKALKQVASGLRHLHALKLVHRDIKPQNILVSTAKAGGTGNNNYRMLISDFGLCKKLDVDQTSFYPTANGAMGAGTVGWRAPEILRGDVKLDDVTDEHSMSSRGSNSTVGGSSSGPPTAGKRTRLTKTVDIFALGCLFYYTMTNGGHPYGDRFEREVNIMKNAKNLDGLASFGEEGTEASDLISQMLDPEASQRPDTTTCLLHPFFWDSSRRLNFLQDASDRFEIMCRDPKDPNLLVLEKEAVDIVGPDWHARLDRAFTENLGKFRKYDGKSVQDLLRALRNKKHHYQDLPENVKRSLGPMPEGFLAYFTRRFPRLFLHVHAVIKDTGLCSEPMFRAYFELPES